MTVIGKFAASSEVGIVIKDPMTLIVQPNGQTGQLAVSLTPYLSMGVFPALAEVQIEDVHIVLVRPVPKRLADMFLELSSGIAIAPAGTRIVAP
jgi:hypothetical protein